MKAPGWFSRAIVMARLGFFLLRTTCWHQQAKAWFMRSSRQLPPPSSGRNSVDFPIEQTYLNFIDEQLKVLLL
jgi:hypothetical protein